MIKNYIKISLRYINRQKIYSFINLSGLAIGMACCILILWYIQDEFVYDKYPERSDQIYRLVIDFITADGGEINTAKTPPPWAPAITADYPEVESCIRFKTPLVSWMISYDELDKRFHESGFYFADPGVFDLFSYDLLKGNPANALTQPNTVVITERMARKYFGDEDPMGKVLRADNTYDFTITGIMKDVPKNSHIKFDFLASFETLLVQPIYGGVDYATFRFTGLFPDVYTYILLKEGYSPGDFEEKMNGFFDTYLAEPIEQANLILKPHLQPLTSIHLHSDRDAELQANSNINYIYIFSAIAIFILLLACINYMNLATARSAMRTKEIGMRKVVGARKSQLIYQFISESLFMAFLSMVLAILIVNLLLPLFNNLSGKELQPTFFDPLILLSLVSLIIIVGLLSGSYPAFLLSRVKSSEIIKDSLNIGSTTSVLRKVLVLLQFSISIVFIICTGIVNKQMKFVLNKELGFKKEQVVVIPIGDPAARQIYLSCKEQLLSSPQIIAVSASLNVPGGLADIAQIHPEGFPLGENLVIEHLMVDHDFIDALGVDLLLGRNFSLSFPTDTFEAFILNETAVNQLGWQENPVGKEINMGNFKNGRVIGVVKDFHIKSLHQKIEPLLIHIDFNPDVLHYFLIRTYPDNIEKTLDLLEEKWKLIYSNDPFIYSFLDDDFDNLYKTEKQRSKVLAAFSILAIFIACLGLLGLASFTAEQRTKEIGIRKAMGSSSYKIVVLLSTEFIKWILIANLIAWPVAWIAMNNWLENFAYRTALSWWIFFAAAALALVVAILTVSYQSVKAANANPVNSLRYE